MSAPESCLELGLCLGSLGLQTLIGPVVDSVFVLLTTVVVCAGMVQPADQPDQLLTTNQHDRHSIAGK